MPAQGGSSTSTADIITFLAGRLPLSAKRPTRPEIHVSQGNIAKPPTPPLNGVRSSETRAQTAEYQRLRGTNTQYQWSDQTASYAGGRHLNPSNRAKSRSSVIQSHPDSIASAAR